MREYSYSSFGLTIRSEIELSQVAAGVGDAQVCIVVGPVPENLENAVAGGAFYQSSSHCLLLRIPGVARYLVSGGNQILVDAAPGADGASVRLFLLGSAIGALLHQRGILPLHGSAIATSRGAVIFSGVSGSGKSDLASTFYRRGYCVLTDDICAVHPGSSPVMMPGPPHLMLWADSVRDIGEDPANLQPVRPQLQKYILPLEQPVQKPAGIHAIYVLEPAIGSGLPALTVPKGLQKIETVTRNIYRPRFVQDLNVRPAQVRQVTELARRTRVRVVNRPLRAFPREELVGLIERDFDA